MFYIFCASVLLILYTYLGYPALLVLFGLLRRKPVKKAAVTPSVSVLIPAFNEENLIGKKILNTLELDYPRDQIEIVVASDGSTDRTNEIVEQFASQGVKLHVGREQRGKCAVLYEAVAIARGDIIVFSDSDAFLKPDALRELVRSFNDPRVGCVEGVRRDEDEQGLMLDSLYWRYETGIKKLNSRLQALIGATGALFAVRRELYSPISPERGDDFEVPIRVRLQGYGVVLEPRALAIHPWLPEDQEFRRIVRIVSWMFQSALILLKEALLGGRLLLAWQLVSHKIIRWLVPVFMALALLSNAFLTGLAFRTLFVLQISFYLMALSGLVADRRKVRLAALLRVPYYFCVINLASLVGLWRYVCHIPLKAWQRPSVRPSTASS